MVRPYTWRSLLRTRQKEEPIGWPLVYRGRVADVTCRERLPKRKVAEMPNSNWLTK